MRVGRACHCQRATIVLQAVGGFVFDRCPTARLVAHVGGNAAALNHEVGDDAMKSGVDVVAVIDVGKKIFTGIGCILHIELDGNVAHGGLD